MSDKAFVHARLTPADLKVLQELKRTTGASESQIVRDGLRLVHEQFRSRPSALTLAGDSVGKFGGAPRDLSTNEAHLDGFGE
jgi:hypothetical protein